MSTRIHGQGALPDLQLWCTLRRWTIARARAHLTGSHLSEPGGPALTRRPSAFFTERFESYTSRYFPRRYSQVMPGSHSDLCRSSNVGRSVEGAAQALVPCFPCASQLAVLGSENSS